MRQVNTLGVDTRFGFRFINLCEGDIAEPEAGADLLVVSAFAGGYRPTPGTALGRLYEKWGMLLDPSAAEFDLRTPFSLWISAPLGIGQFGRVLCLEMRGTGVAVGELLRHAFVGVAVLEATGIEIGSVTLPVLGSGQQGLPASSIIEALLPAVRSALERSPSLGRVVFVDRDGGKVAQLSEAMDKYLRRSPVRLVSGEVLSSLRADIRNRLEQLTVAGASPQTPLFGELAQVLAAEKIQASLIGTLGRRLVEHLVNRIGGGDQLGIHDLASKIERLRDRNVAPWIRSYMHTLRLLGNEAAHEMATYHRRPPYVVEDDLLIGLFCVQRLLGFAAAD